VNWVLVGETTYRATRDVIVYAERQPVEAKGKAGQIGFTQRAAVRRQRLRTNTIAAPRARRPQRMKRYLAMLALESRR
jgi:hypothetical protein